MNIDNATLNLIPGAVGVKNSESCYIAANEQLALCMGYAKSSDVIGLSDHDIKHEMVAIADCFIDQDKRVMKNEVLKHLDIGHYLNGDLQIHFSEKKPLIENDKIVGTVFYCTNLDTRLFVECYSALIKKHGPAFYTLTPDEKIKSLSMRERETLFYVLRGYTAKEIGLRLAISHKTAEYHTEQIKNKLSCCNKSELIEAGLHLGFMEFLPISLLSKLI